MSAQKILLINPSLTRPNEFNTLKRFIPVGLPHGMGYLAGYLADKKMDYEIFDELIEPLYEEELKRLIVEKNITIVGISCMTPFIYRAMDILRNVKRISGDIKTVLGGVHPTIMPEECLKNENVDYVVRREGEITLWEFMRSLDGDQGFEQIQGLSYKIDGKIVHNPDRPLIDNIDTLPDFPYHFFKKNADRYNLKILSSRGCPANCIFCSARSVWSRRYRYRSGENVVKDIEILINRFGKKRISFVDDTFTANKKRIIELCELIMKKNLHKKAIFFCNTRGDTVDRELLEIMKAAGFRGISLGIETASDRLMKIIKKGETVEDNIRAVRMAHDVGLKVRGTFILGFPTETREETLETIKLALRNPFEFARFGLPIPFPGTELYEIARSEGIEFNDYTDFDVRDGFLKKQAVYIPIGRTRSEMSRLQRKAYFRFYFRIGQVINFLKIGLPELDLKSFGLFERLRLGFKIIVKFYAGKKPSAKIGKSTEGS